MISRALWALRVSCLGLLILIGTGCDGTERKIPPRASNGVMDLSGWDFARNGPSPLDGTWEFYWNKNRADLLTGEPSAAKAMSVPVPADWTNFRRPNGAAVPGFGFAVYRLRVRLEKPAELAVKMLDAATAYNLYIDGRLLLSNGRVGKTAADTEPRFLPRVSPSVRLAENFEIMVEVANFSHRKGGLWESIRIGRRRDLQRIRDTRIWSDLFVAGSVLIMALYHFGLYALRRKDPTALLFGLFCVDIVARLLVVGERPMFAIWPAFDWSTGVRMAYLSAYLSGPIFLYYMHVLFPEELTRFRTRLFAWPMFALSALVIILPLHWYSRTLIAWYSMVLLAGIWVLVALIRAIARKRPGAGIALAGALPLFATLLNDSLYADLVINTGYMIHYGLFSFIFCQAFLLSRRFSGAFALSEALSEDLSASNRRLVSLDKLKDEFLANTSHELRTPLHGIIGIAESLRAGIAGELSPEAIRQLRLVINSGHRLSSLVNDILDLSRLKHKDILLKKKAVNLHPLADVVLELNALGAASAGLELRNEIPADFPPVLADENRLQQILHNLVGNAVKFTERGMVTITARPGGDDMVEISVTDTGPGVPPEQQERIFQSFEQVDGGADRAHGGAGLGLSITRALVELHGGRIAVESPFASGSRFTFSLPSARDGEALTAPPIAAESPAREPAPAFLGAAADGIRREKESGNAAVNIRVLIVDDELVNLQVLANYVELRNWRAITATSGAEALEILERDANIHAMVLDLMMPRMSGFETARRVREKYSLLDLPILMLTARNRTEDLVAGLRAGANDYLVKPVDRDETLLRLSNLINMRAAHRERLTARRKVSEAIRHERRKINENLHDHLGGQLVDMRFLAREIGELTRDHPEPARRLEEQIKKITAMLRDQMLFNEDLDLLSEDFFEGINLILLRRYTGADRELYFTSDRDADWPGDNLSEPLMAGLYAVTKEIATNDLKYGRGMTSWSIALRNAGPRDDVNGTFRGPTITLRMEAETRYRLENHGTGMGTQNITRRMAELGGTFHAKLQGNRITILLSAPLT